MCLLYCGREIVTGRESSLLKPVLVNLQKSLMEQVKAENWGNQLPRW